MSARPTRPGRYAIAILAIANPPLAFAQNAPPFPGYFGDRDPRYDAATYITSADDRKRFSGIGKIRCATGRQLLDTKTGKYEPEVKTATGFQVGSFRIVVTNAHTFTEETRNPDRSVSYRHIDPRNCEAIFVDHVGDELEFIKIAEIKSRWKEAGLLGDRSHDIAIALLEKDSTAPAGAPPLKHQTSHSNFSNRSIYIVGYVGGLADSHLFRKRLGKIYTPLQGFVHQQKASQQGTSFYNQSIFVGDYFASSRSSGSPIFDLDYNVIGIHQGNNHISRFGISKKEFSSYNNYQFGILFDKKFYDDLMLMMSK